MKSFLEECAEDILHKYDNDNSVCVVFPNNRTMLNFRKIYARLKSEVSFAGALYPINRVLEQFCHASNADELTLLFQLYEAFRAVFNHDGMLNQNLALDFDSFFDTGRKILSDFNEIDNYLVDINQLCRNFADISELEAAYSDYDPEVVEIIKTFWNNFSQERLSREKRRYMELWVGLPEVYRIFRENLAKIHSSYSGMHNRNIVELIKQGKLSTRFNMYVFVGFNVLNKCERRILSYLRQSGKARFYWDADNYYIADKAQESGLFMRGYLSDFPDELYPKQHPDNIVHQPKEVEYIGVPLEVAQAKAVHDILDKWQRKPGYTEEKTAVVLGDEHLLFPVLNSIPESTQRVNVTMGYPFVETPVYSFVQNCLQMRGNMRSSKTGVDFYYKDVLAIINHPLVANLPEFYSRQITAKIKDERMIRVKAEFLGSYSNILALVFPASSDTDKPLEILNNYLQILSELYFIKNPNPSDTPKLENEFIFKAYTSIKNLYNNFESLPQQEVDSDLVVSILKQHLIQIKVPFESDDDRGIQVMGMMETRNLDFDNVIMLGMNEGVFPKRSENDSFITEGMRLAFDMPVVKYKDAVFGYFFYRLFQRAKSIKILYNNVFATNISGEESRFAKQIMKEASRENRPDSELDIIQRQFVREISPAPSHDIDVDSNADTIARLARYYTPGKEGRALSPSAINTYLQCPLKFYLKYVVSLHAVDDIDEEGTAADFGSILHGAIEHLYTDIRDSNRIITLQDIEKLDTATKERYVLDSYNDHFHVSVKDKGELSGFESIFFDVLVKYLERILQYDKTIAPFELVGAEKGAYASVDIDVEGRRLSINIGGTLDRIDRVISTGKLRIVDYKTGNMEGRMSFGGVDDAFDVSKLDNRPKEVFQVLLYSYVYMQKHPGVFPTPIIYAVRKDITEADSMFRVGNKEDGWFQVTDSNIGRLTEDFSVKLKELLAKIFDPSQKFPACRTNYCKNCDFKNLCKV